MFLCVSANCFGQDYVSGKELCQDISKQQNGKWLSVLNSYSEQNSEKSPLYYRFLNGKYDSKKPTVIYVDGGPGGTSHNYHKMYDELSLEYNILFFDQRGFVCSRPDSKLVQDDPSFYSVANSARDIEEIRKELGVKDLIVLGHSFGATISLKYAELFPQNLSKVTLIGPAFITPENKKLQKRFDRDLKVQINKMINDDIHNCDSLEFINNLAYDFANSLGLQGLEGLINKIERDLLAGKPVLTEDEAYNFLSELMGDNEGRYSLRDDSFTWETQGDTEIIISNDFQCSFLSDQEEEPCVDGGDGYKNTFDVRKLKIDVPVDIFLGEYDGVKDELKQLRTYLDQGNFYYLNERGHGTFTEYYDLKDAEREVTSLRVLSLSLSGKKIPSKLKTHLGTEDL
jgi:pimeloyl-ACP methyl ester carboxylesterase